MTRFKDLTNQRFGRLFVKNFAGRDNNGFVLWTTVDNCCIAAIANTTYSSWCNMLRRCNNSNFKQYADYGGRGIRACTRWQGKHGFENFLADMGPRPDGTSLDRYPNNDGNYEPGNCRWATRKEQQNNRRCSA